MKKVITLAIVVVSLLSMGCNSLKRQINPNQQKIGVEGEDYTLSYHKLKKGYAEILKINVIDRNLLQRLLLYRLLLQRKLDHGFSGIFLAE